MQLRRPSFKNEYTCLSKDLSVVPFWQTWQELESKLIGLQDKKVNITRESNAYDRAYSTVCDGIKARLGSIPRSPDKRVEYLDQIGNDMVRRDLCVTKMPRTYSAEIMHILLMYAQIDMEKLKEDWAGLFGTVDRTAQAEVDGSIGGTTKKLNNHLANIAKVFAEEKIPTAFRGISVPENNGPELLGLAQTVVRSFIADWRSRAPQFLVPVTINGLDIRSLPEDTRDIWQEAYDSLGLGDLRKRPNYVAIKATLPQTPENMFSLSAFSE